MKRLGHSTACRAHGLLAVWFQLTDRSLQTCADSVFPAEESDFGAATHRVHLTPDRASRIEVQILP